MNEREVVRLPEGSGAINQPPRGGDQRRGASLPAFRVKNILSQLCGLSCQPRHEFLGPLALLLTKKSAGKPVTSLRNPGQTGVSIMSGMCNNGVFWQRPPAHHRAWREGHTRMPAWPSARASMVLRRRRCDLQSVDGSGGRRAFLAFLSLEGRDRCGPKLLQSGRQELPQTTITTSA